MENVNKQHRNFISLSQLGYGPLEFNFRRVAYIWQSKWVGITAIKTEGRQIYFLSDVFVAVASLDLKVAIVKSWRHISWRHSYVKSSNFLCRFWKVYSRKVESWTNVSNILNMTCGMTFWIRITSYHKNVVQLSKNVLSVLLSCRHDIEDIWSAKI